MVVLADVNVEAGAEAAAEGSAPGCGAGRALGLAINVTDGASVEEAIHQVVRTYGGLDVFVSNAGVLKAGSVKTQTGEGLRLRHRRELQGLLPLRAEGRADPGACSTLARPDYWSDIIQINSKSGLAGLEPERRLRRQQVRRHRPDAVLRPGTGRGRHQGQRHLPGQLLRRPALVRPAERPVRAVPAQRQGAGRQDRRGREARSTRPRSRWAAAARAADVMKAIYYLIEQKYETGQAVPVTGGQVMLK